MKNYHCRRIRRWARAICGPPSLCAQLTLLGVAAAAASEFTGRPFSLPDLIDLRADDNLIEEIDVAEGACITTTIPRAESFASTGHRDVTITPIFTITSGPAGQPLTKRQFLDIPGCDDDEKTTGRSRAANLPKWASRARRPVAATSTSATAWRRAFRRHSRSRGSCQCRMRGDGTGTDRVVAGREKSVNQGATIDTPRERKGRKIGDSMHGTTLRCASV